MWRCSNYATGIVEDLRTLNRNIPERKEDDTLMIGKQVYIGRRNWCLGYVEKLGNNRTVSNEQKANLRVTHMATKSRPM